MIIIPLKDDDVETTFQRHIEIFKERVFSNLKETEFFLTIKDLHRAVNTPRQYPYCEKFHVKQAVKQLLQEKEIVCVGGTFYTTPSNFKKYRKKSKKKKNLLF